VIYSLARKQSLKGKNMKQPLIALLLSSLCTSLMAQNVTIYGQIDTAIQSYDTKSETFTRSADNVFNTSRLGFRGTEDLGGGLQAHFVLEGAMSPASGTFGSTTTNQTFNRESRVGLSGAFGEIRLGRTDVTMATEVDTYVGAIAPNWHLTPVNGTAIELGADQNSVVKYITPVMGGLQIELGLANSNGHGTTTDANTDTHSVSARFEKNAFRLSAGYARLKGISSDAEREAITFGIGQDFGFVKLGLSHAQGDVSTSTDTTSKGTVLSLAMPVGNGVTLATAYAITENGEQVGDNKGRGFLVGGYKSLSKRTTLYALHTNITNQQNSVMAWSHTTTPAVAGQDPKAWSVGINHVF